jgi:F-type H+-transporting ATPase subunit epsilon
VEKSFSLNILTSTKTIFAADIISLIAPAELGYLGVLANHAPLIANLVSGKLILRDQSGKLTIIHSLGKGVLQVFKNNVTVLLENVEYP